MRFLTRNIWLVSLVSLFTDMASEMLYPVMPAYLRSIGFSMALIGFLEGIVEAVAGLSKGFFGQWSDRLQQRVVFIRAGYAASALSKPLLGLFTFPAWIFFARMLDRLGKGARTGPRDALLSDETTPDFKGRVFGFHRSMDTLGAVLGPLLALWFLHLYPGQYVWMFVIAFVPGLMATGLTFLLRDRMTPPSAAAPKRPGLLDFIRFWPKSPAAYRRATGVLLAFALFNSSDVFLLLRLKESGQSDTGVILFYMAFNLSYALLAFPLGRLADKLGFRRVLAGGLLLYAAVYAGMASGGPLSFYALLFVLYGLYCAATEGVAKAWLSNLVPPAQTGTAIGTFTAFQSLAVMWASTFAGLLWQWAGPAAAFAVPAAAAVVAAIFLGSSFLKGQ